MQTIARELKKTTKAEYLAKIGQQQTDKDDQRRKGMAAELERDSLGSSRFLSFTRRRNKQLERASKWASEGARLGWAKNCREGHTIQWTKVNQSKLELHEADAKRGKKCASESRFVFVLLLIGWKSGASFLSQSCSVAKRSWVDHFRYIKIQRDSEV